MPVTCTEILDDGAGPLGRSVELPGPAPERAWAADAAGYAERAAHQFDELDILSGWRDLSDIDAGTSRVIEVAGLPGGPERFRVTCQVVRNYKVAKVEG